MSDLHFINVGLAGTFQKTGTASSEPRDVAAIIEHLDKNNIDRIGIYVHGGLVDEAAGIAGADRFRIVFDGSSLHGVSLVWETGWLETIQKNLQTVLSTELFREIVKKVIEKVLQRFTGGGAKGPVETQVEAEAVLRDPPTDAAFAAQVRAVAEEQSAKAMEAWREDLIGDVESELESDEQFQDLYVNPDQRTHLFDDPDLPADAEDQGPREKGVITWLSVASKIARISWRVGTRFWNKRDHGLHITAVEEVFREFYLADLIKTLQWDNMKRAAREMWLPNEGLADNAQHAGTFLLERLIELKQRRPNLVIDLVGHSAGAIVVCEMFDAIRQRYPKQLPIRNVIFLAPAVTSSLFYTHMIKHPGQFENFHMFTMPDELEMRDAVLRPALAALAIVYPASLLYVVSGMLEEEVDTPLLGMMRYSTGESPYDSQQLEKIREFLANSDPKRITLSSANGVPSAGSLFSGSTSHGGFSSDQHTLTSIQSIIKKSNRAMP